MVRRHARADDLARRLVTTAGVVGMLAVIAMLTLTPNPAQAARAAQTPWYCLLCGETGTADVILNILLFIPLGVALRQAGVRRPSAVLLGLAVSVTVELLQATAIPGRDASLSDVLTNTAGTAAGVWLSQALPRLIDPPPRLARRLAAWGLAAIALSWGFTDWAFRGAPGPAPHHASWRPTRPFDVPFPGRVLQARLGADDIAPGVVPAEPLDSAFDRSDLQVEARIVAGGPVRDLAVILEVADARDRPVITLAQSGYRLHFSVRTNASRVGLREPAARLEHGVPYTIGDTATIYGRVIGRRLEARSVYREGPDHRLRTRVASRSLSPLLGWSLLLGLNPDGQGGRWISAAWIGLPFLIVGYWLSRSSVSIRRR